MCLAVVAIDVHPRFRLVVVANRDEFHRRPTAPAQWWPEGWFGGRDLAAGGTWLGIAPSGRWALLTNVREPSRHDPTAPSRGAWVPTFLRDERAPVAGLADACAAPGNGFNLLGGDTAGIGWGSNRAAAPAPLEQGIHALSNALLDTPWPKVVRSRALLQRWSADPKATLDDLVDLLDDRNEAPDAELPATGVSLAWERRLSAPFIVGADYGTRCSTAFTIDARHEVQFVERSFTPDGRCSGVIRESFRLRDR